MPVPGLARRQHQIDVGIRHRVLENAAADLKQNGVFAGAVLQAVTVCPCPLELGHYVASDDRSERWPSFRGHGQPNPCRHG